MPTSSLTTRSNWPNELSDSATGVVANYRTLVKVRASASSLQLMFPGVYGGSEAAVPNNYTVQVSVEYPIGTFNPVLFSGVRTGTVVAGSKLVSDALALAVVADTDLAVRVYVDAGVAGRFPRNVSVRDAAEGAEFPALSNKVDAGTIAFSSAHEALAPVVIYGTSTDRHAVAVLGDSTICGSDDDYFDHGWVRRGLDGSVPYASVALGGDSVGTVAVDPSGAVRYAVINGSRHAIVLYGSNNVGAGQSAATVEAKLYLLYNRLFDMGMTVTACTILPRSTSTDGWVTTVNQTAWTFDAVRTAVNDWIRTLPGRVAHVLDSADFCETARNSGIWKAGYTDSVSSGVHPTPATQAAMATALIVPAAYP